MDDGFSVVLENVGTRPLLTMKFIMEITGIGLSDAKNMVDEVPSVVATGMNIDEACELRDGLEYIGNTVFIPELEL